MKSQSLIAIPEITMPELRIVRKVELKTKDRWGNERLLNTSREPVFLGYISEWMIDNKERSLLKLASFYNQFQFYTDLETIGLKRIINEHPDLHWHRFISKPKEEEIIIENTFRYVVHYKCIKQSIISYIEQKLDYPRLVSRLKELFNDIKPSSKTYEEMLTAKTDYLLNLDKEGLLDAMKKDFERQVNKRLEQNKRRK